METWEIVLTTLSILIPIVISLITWIVISTNRLRMRNFMADEYKKLHDNFNAKLYGYHSIFLTDLFDIIENFIKIKDINQKEDRLEIYCIVKEYKKVKKAYSTVEKLNKRVSWNGFEGKARLSRIQMLLFSDDEKGTKEKEKRVKMINELTYGEFIYFIKNLLVARDDKNIQIPITNKKMIKKYL